MPELDQQQLSVAVDEILNRWPAVGLAVGAIRDGRLESFHAHGLADIGSNTPITQDTVFRIGSITKTVTAVAVMQIWERGLVDLDAPANDYLRTYQLVPAKPNWRPATVRHLLTHTAGVPEWVHPVHMIKSGWFGETYPLEKQVPTLADFYHGSLRLAVEPGTIWAYADHGIATVGQIVEDISGQPLHVYLHDHVFQPLGMANTDLLRSDRVRPRLAQGYTLSSKGAKAVTERQGVTAAAGSIYSTPTDMARYIATLLNGGAGEHGSILKPETVAMMFEPHYQPDPRIPGMGLAFFRVNLGGHPAVEHQGVVPGFNSQIFLAPKDRAGVMAFTNGAANVFSTTWLMGESERLLRDLIGVPSTGIRTDVPHHPAIWGDLCGWYRRRAQRTDMMAWSMVGAGAQVAVRRGKLMLRALSPVPALYRGLRLHPDDPDDPYVFRVDLSAYGMDTARLVFSRDAAGATTGLHLDGLFLSAQKRSVLRNPRQLPAGIRAEHAMTTTAIGVQPSNRRRRPGRT
jgi:CubicO group peptidase (beta-lactamase class C family)